MPQSVSVSDLEIFRVWQADDELDQGWLLTRLFGKAPLTESMKAGTAFHEALERSHEDELGTLAIGDYRFDFNCACELELPAWNELPVQKQYGDLVVRGRVDGIIGKEVIDYKTTDRFDPDRLLESYQWRFYLDMLEADRFRWEVFVLSEFGRPGSYHCYEVRQTHRLIQTRYPGLEEDCARLAREYSQFVQSRDFADDVKIRGVAD